MKKIIYIFLFLVFGFFGKTVGLTVQKTSAISLSKGDTFDKYKKCSCVVKPIASKVRKQKHPKKPRAIKVLIPEVSTYVVSEFHSYSDFSLNELKSVCVFTEHYSHGKRGPPTI